jgi:hypothetical protein
MISIMVSLSSMRFVGYFGFFVGAAGIAFTVWITVVFFASLPGVVTFERRGPRRCTTLMRGSFWRVLGRLLTAVILVVLYSTAAGWAADLLSGSMPWGYWSIYAVLTLPVHIFGFLVTLTTYTGLRYRENRGFRTTSLCDEIASLRDGLPSS